MALDFNKLLENPLFQTGLATLGGAGNPGLLNAYQALQARKKIELEQQQQKIQQEQHEANLEQTRTRTRLWEKQLATDERKQQAILDFLKRRQQSTEGQGGVPGMSPGAITPSAQPQPALALPPEPVGKHGTPVRILDNIMKMESNGNPNAIGPLISPKLGRAMGAMQFTQDTINELKADGIVFNPFDIAQSRDAADYLLQKRAKALGSMEKAVASYGGFAAKDPTAYISKALAGSPEKQVQQFAENNALAEQSRKYKALQEEAGAMRLLGGDMGGISDIVAAEKPDYGPAQEVRAQAAERRAEEAARREANKPPEGYVKSPEGKVTPKLTVEEGKATAYVTQMSDAQKTFEQLKKKGYDPTSFLTQAGTAMAGGVDTPIPGVTLPTNVLATGIQQQAKQAQNMWAEAYLRFKTGAATNASEIATNVKTFFPQFGDKKDNIAQKERARKVVEKAVEVSAGRGIDALPPELRKQFEAVTGGGEARTEVRRWKGPKTGRTVIEYSDGSKDYAD